MIRNCVSLWIRSLLSSPLPLPHPPPRYLNPLVRGITIHLGHHPLTPTHKTCTSNVSLQYRTVSVACSFQHSWNQCSVYTLCWHGIAMWTLWAGLSRELKLPIVWRDQKPPEEKDIDERSPKHRLKQNPESGLWLVHSWQRRYTRCWRSKD